jgi:hypothetical protein
VRNRGQNRNRCGDDSCRSGNDGIGETPNQTTAVVAAVMSPPCKGRRGCDSEGESDKTCDHGGSVLHHRYSEKAARDRYGHSLVEVMLMRPVIKRNGTVSFWRM